MRGTSSGVSSIRGRDAQHVCPAPGVGPALGVRAERQHAAPRERARTRLAALRSEWSRGDSMPWPDACCPVCALTPARCLEHAWNPVGTQETLALGVFLSSHNQGQRMCPDSLKLHGQFWMKMGDVSVSGGRGIISSKFDLRGLL